MAVDRRRQIVGAEDVVGYDQSKETRNSPLQVRAR
jgi:hypothetical protein